jgi:hypothetical protein
MNSLCISEFHFASKGKKVKVPLCLTKQHAMKAYWGSRGIAPLILNFGARWGEWPASRSGRFTPGTHWIGGWVGPRFGLDTVAKRKILSSCRESNPGRPTNSLTTIPTKLSLPVGNLIN